MSKSKYVVRAVICFILLALYIVLIVMYICQKPFEYPIYHEEIGTVKEITIEQNNRDIKVFTNEYREFLRVRQDSIQKRNIDKLAEIKPGEKIYFRLSPGKEILSAGAIDTLRTDSFEVISLDDYKYSMSKKLTESIVCMAIALSLLLGGAITSLVNLKKVKQIEKQHCTEEKIS